MDAARRVFCLVWLFHHDCYGLEVWLFSRLVWLDQSSWEEERHSWCTQHGLMVLLTLMYGSGVASAALHIQAGGG